MSQLSLRVTTPVLKYVEQAGSSRRQIAVMRSEFASHLINLASKATRSGTA
jgi:hypothetical protein